MLRFGYNPPILPNPVIYHPVTFSWEGAPTLWQALFLAVCLILVAATYVVAVVVLSSDESPVRREQRKMERRARRGR